MVRNKCYVLFNLLHEWDRLIQLVWQVDQVAHAEKEEIETSADSCNSLGLYPRYACVGLYMDR